ncbi:MAG TPA: hypothetical protein VFZ53_08145 [Polyangiaceae bacterium]
MFACTRKNLGDRARAQALRGGVFFAGVTLVSGLLAFELHAVRSLGWFLALPVAISAYGLISGTLGICAYHGMKGSRGADHGAEAVLDDESRSRMRVRSLLAVSASLLVGVAFAAAFVASV